MWEQIRANRRRSVLLIVLMGGLLALMGYTIGESIVGPGAGPLGLAVAGVIFLVQLLVYYAAAESVLLAGMGARELSREDMPRLFNIVEEMKLASGLGFMPKVYVIDSPAPNAFAIGRKPESSAVAVTSGLLSQLNRDELQGVIAHEIAHLKNRDTSFMTLAGVMLGSIIMLSELAWRLFRYGGVRTSSRSRSRGGGQAQAVIIVVALLVAIIGPIVAQILYFATSRKREFLADACAAQYTRYPEGLASALERIASAPARLVVSKATAPMFIVNPLSAADRESTGLFSTHPPTSQRVAILRSMAGAGLGDYDAAYRAVRGGGLIGGMTLKSAEAVPLREASAEGPLELRPEAREAVQRLAGYVSVPCACGLEARVPESFTKSSVRCPRCGTVNAIPSASVAGSLPAGAAAVAAGALEQPALQFTRRGGAWETFRCACGGTIQLSPSFSGTQVRCGRCGRNISVRRAA
jgi:heat shock protein HtpX